MPVSESQKKATKKYKKEHYDEIRFLAPKGKKEQMDVRATELKLSRAAYLNKLVDDDLAQAGERDG